MSFEPGVIPWNNYELGYNLFPIVARDAEDRDLAFHLGFLAKFRSNDPPVLTETMLSGLDVLLMKYNGKIDKIVLYGRDPRIEAVIFKWYIASPFIVKVRPAYFVAPSERSAVKSADRCYLTTSLTTFPLIIVPVQ